jgi:hypothetical protein
MVDDAELEEKLMQVAFSDPRETSPEIFAKLGRTLRDGEILFREGETSTELIIIVSGKCKITKMVGGQEKMLAVLGAEEILGEMSHFDDAPRSATARAVGTLNVLSFSRENFGMIFELHHKWTLKLIQALANRINGTFQRLVAAHDEPLPPEMAQAAALAAPPPSLEPVPAELDGAQVERFLSDIRTALGLGVLLEDLKARASGRLQPQQEQSRRIDLLFGYVERRLRAEGLID